MAVVPRGEVMSGTAVTIMTAATAATAVIAVTVATAAFRSLRTRHAAVILRAAAAKPAPVSAVTAECARTVRITCVNTRSAAAIIEICRSYPVRGGPPKGGPFSLFSKLNLQ